MVELQNFLNDVVMDSPELGNAPEHAVFSWPVYSTNTEAQL
jgi:hypothetical protein